MRRICCEWRRCAVVLTLIAYAAAVSSAQDSFRWIDFHSDELHPNQDQGTIIWVARALAGEKWTAIREIGVMYDAALVVTTERAAPDASPNTDTFHVWSVSLKDHLLTSLITGVNLRWVDSMELTAGAPHEPAILYDDCNQCAATTYFTTFHYDARQHTFTPRWLRGSQTVPLWTAAAPSGVTLSQVYAVLPIPESGAVKGGEFLATWSHFDYGGAKPAQDFIYRYDRDPLTGLDRFQQLTGKDAEAMKEHLCMAQTNPGLSRGQDSTLCAQSVHVRPERKPVTTPPANNQGRSTPGHVR